MRGLLLAVPLSLLAACHPTEPGVQGHVEFSAYGCGAATCDLADPLAVGATVGISLEALGDLEIDQLRIRTSSGVAEVLSEDNDGDGPFVTVRGNRPGTVDLVAYDRAGAVIDSLTIEVAAADGFTIAVTGAEVDGPHYLAPYNAQYNLTTGKLIDVDVTAQAAGGPLLGAMTYQVEVTPGLSAAVVEGDRVDSGHFQFLAPAGEHDLMVALPGFERSYRFSVR